ncbi:F0F1 ATP synthase subunit delta [Blattabacterium cuenoti]|uniref:F0F1 ATP synthase subunit delta n=1 Tax=Blattabacterium cuenoti TaxID=1653831 RepID=UPI00163CFCB6|nr:F0F1 ATP synthase subunit delta [Blattabacterium cuenoti]
MISYKTIIQHYATILFELTEDIINNKNITNTNYFIIIIKNIKNYLYKNSLLKKFLYTSLISKQKKINIINELFNYFKCDIFIFQFVKLLILKNRLFLLEEIFLKYIDIYNEIKNNTIKCMIISPIFIDKKIQENIAKKILNLKGKKYNIINKIDKSIIGGFLFIYNYKEWNYSINKQLDRINTEI